jgi:hypothetical protein
VQDEFPQPNAQPNTIATVSAVLGGLSFVGSGCCCVPLLNYIAMILVPLLATAAIVTGIIGRSKVAETGSGGTASLVGIVGGAMTFLVAIGLFLFTAIMGAGFGILGALLDNGNF